MRPSEVRDRVLSDHRHLSERLDSIEGLARGVLDDREPLPSTLREEAEALLDRLAIHMAWEDLHLVPILRAADGWGDVRTDRFAEEHREQREMLGYVLRQLHDLDRPEDVVAVNVLDLVALLRADIVAEESVFLDERVVRDDPVVIDLLSS